MPKHEAPLNTLEKFLPSGTYPQVAAYLHEYKVHLTITRARRTILGNYQPRQGGDHHRISVNGNLNPYAFLVTLLHELAHLLTYEQYGWKIASHGKEWKSVYSRLLATFLENHSFPADLERELRKTLRNPAATSCAEEDLLRVLRQFDPPVPNRLLVEDLPPAALFRTPDNRIFRKEEKLRKRFRCVEVSTGRVYLFSPVYEVALVKQRESGN